MTFMTVRMTKKMAPIRAKMAVVSDSKTVKVMPSIKRMVIVMEKPKLTQSHVRKVKLRPSNDSSRHCESSLWANV